jgi:N-acetylneuraminic acid mutarotase
MTVPFSSAGRVLRGRRWLLAGLVAVVAAPVVFVAVSSSAGHPHSIVWRDYVTDGTATSVIGGVAQSGTATASARSEAVAQGKDGVAAASASATGTAGAVSPTATVPSTTVRPAGPAGAVVPAAHAPGVATPPATSKAGWRKVPAAPVAGRFGHAATWTGREMVVWGGQADYEAPLGNDGAAYDPAAGTWRVLSAAPLSGRVEPVAAWTGHEVIIWGGLSDEGANLVDGALWDPTTNSWRRVPDSPLGPREGAAVVWAGDRLAVWGGLDGDGIEHADGAAFDPVAGRWVSMAPAPLTGRAYAQAAWTGTRLIVSGGIRSDQDKDLTDGAAWDPAAGTWRRIAAQSEGASCSGRESCGFAWTGTRVLFPASATAYDPAADAWLAMSSFPGGEMVGWLGQATVWTGTRLIAWGGATDDGESAAAGPAGAVYDPVANRWKALEKAPAARRREHTAVWTGDEMIVWGGLTGDAGLADGVTYRPGA